MGNQSSSTITVAATNNSLIRRLKYNDRTLDELELTNSPVVVGISNDNQNLDDFLDALRRNRTVKSIVIATTFTEFVTGILWRDFLEAMICMKGIEQLELLETDIPFFSLPRIISSIRTLKAIGIYHGSFSTSIQNADIEMLSNAFENVTALEEFVWEQNFESLNHRQNNNNNNNDFDENEESALDPLLLALSKLPNLEVLTISANPTNSVQLFSPMALETLCESSGKLSSLDVSGCGLRAFHFEVLLSTLAGQKSIKRLHVQRNPEAAYNIATIVQLAQENYSLQEVLISDASDFMKQQLDFWLLLNKTIHKRLNFTVSPSSEEQFRIWSSLVVEMSGNPEILFYLLNEYQEYWIHGGNPNT